MLFSADKYRLRWNKVTAAMVAGGYHTLLVWRSLRYDEPLQAGMVMAAEMLLTHSGVGTAEFEQNLIVTEHGSEFLTQTPMICW